MLACDAIWEEKEILDVSSFCLPQIQHGGGGGGTGVWVGALETTIQISSSYQVSQKLDFAYFLRALNRAFHADTFNGSMEEGENGRKQLLVEMTLHC